MASAWIARRKTATKGVTYRVMFRLGGRESSPRYAGSFKTMEAARARRSWVIGELAAMRVPDVSALVEPEQAPLLRDIAEQWQASRVDVREGTATQHRVALARVMPTLGGKPVDAIAVADVADLVARLHAAGKARGTIRKSVLALAMVLDHAGIDPNPARNRVQVRLPREEPDEMEPPVAAHVEACAWRLTPRYLLALLVLDATGVRLNELCRARVGDLDEECGGWLIRGAVSKTRKPRWALLPPDLLELVVERLPAREDRDPSAPLFDGVEDARLRMAIMRGCRDAGVPVFTPHSLRHRRISLLHRQGVSWADIGAMVGQRSRSVTADTYSHALIDPREIDRKPLLELIRDRAVQTPVQPSRDKVAI